MAKGFSQPEEIDINQIFSPIVYFETVQLMLALTALKDWYISGLNVQSAHLYGKLDKKIYMEQLDGFTIPRQAYKVLKLLQALNRLKQAGLAW